MATGVETPVASSSERTRVGSLLGKPLRSYVSKSRRPSFNVMTKAKVPPTATPRAPPVPVTSKRVLCRAVAGLQTTANPSGLAPSKQSCDPWYDVDTTGKFAECVSNGRACEGMPPLSKSIRFCTSRDGRLTTVMPKRWLSKSVETKATSPPTGWYTSGCPIPRSADTPTVKAPAELYVKHVRLDVPPDTTAMPFAAEMPVKGLPGTVIGVWARLPSVFTTASVGVTVLSKKAKPSAAARSSTRVRPVGALTTSHCNNAWFGQVAYPLAPRATKNLLATTSYTTLFPIIFLIGAWDSFATAEIALIIRARASTWTL
jgi:hypothetical protein